MNTAGIAIENFEFLLKRARSAAVENKCTVSLKNRLFIFLIIMKTVFFCVNETTISRIFFSMMHHLSSTTANLVFWPDKKMVQSTMPECFKPEFANTRVTIDCTLQQNFSLEYLHQDSLVSNPKLLEEENQIQI